MTKSVDGEPQNASTVNKRHYIFGIVYCIFVGLPALNLCGFLDVGIPWTLSSALTCATLGGAVSGIICCPKPFLAGLVGGMIAGPLAVLTLQFYINTFHRHDIWNYEAVVVLLIASIPGVLVGKFIHGALQEQTLKPPDQQSS